MSNIKVPKSLTDYFVVKRPSTALSTTGQNENTIRVNEGVIILFSPRSQVLDPSLIPQETEWNSSLEEVPVPGSNFTLTKANTRIYLKLTIPPLLGQEEYLFDFGSGDDEPHPDFHNGASPVAQARALTKSYSNPTGEIIKHVPTESDPEPENSDGITHILLADITLDIDVDRITKIQQWHKGPIYWQKIDILYGYWGL